MLRIKKVSFDSVSKHELSEFNKAEIQGWVVDQFLDIEGRINDLIVNHFKPENEALFRTVLLNSSILTIGGKIKVLANIGIPNTTIDKIRKLNSIRNGFAHTRIGEHISIFVSKDKTESENVNIEAESILNVMNSTGKLVSKKAYDYAKEFLSLRNDIRVELKQKLLQ